MSMRWSALGALMAFVGCAAPAGAVVRTAIYSGYVTASFCGNRCAPDDLGLFGGGSLLNDAFTFTYVYDAEAAPVYYSGNDFQSGLGGANQYPQAVHYAPFGSATLTINGYAVSLTGTQFGSINRARGDHAGSAPRDGVQIYDGDNYHYVQLGVDFPGTIAAGSYSYIDNFTFDTVGTFHPRERENNPDGLGHYDLLAQGSFLFSPDMNTSHDTYGQLHVTSVTYRIGGAVPEPASWAMMVAGFGMLGATMRTRRREKASVPDA